VSRLRQRLPRDLISIIHSQGEALEEVEEAEAEEWT